MNISIRDDFQPTFALRHSFANYPCMPPRSAKQPALVLTKVAAP